ncbi:MAG: B12-binding domain-containing radical SAM protein [Nitrososphaerota archaeon]
MIQVNSAQFNFQYGNQIHFPYSIASLVAYIKSKEKLRKHFRFEKTFVFRQKIEEYIKNCKNSDILLCSCYVWNWEITTYLAKQVKKINSDCLVIFGGPQVPLNTSGFFEKYPFVDILVHNEGEYLLENIFNAYLSDKDYSKINGITTKKFSTPPQSRIDDLDTLPSPYLTNVVWDLVEKIDGVNWTCCWETNRGCPYQCTFCDWGSATFTKLRQFSEQRLYEEIEWFGKNKIVFIDCCDANFGIFYDRDLRLARKLKEMKLKTKHLQKMAVSWAKNSSEKIIPIAKELQDAGILGAVTLAVQSLDQNTLKIIKRANIKFEKFSDLTKEFRLNGIPTYSEIIRGLPGETLESFKTGLEILMNTKIGSVNIYHDMILPNAPMNEPSYREKYNIKIIRSPIMLQHSSIDDKEIQEYEYIVVSTNTFSLDNLKEMYLYSWAFLVLQKFGILEQIAEYYHQEHDILFMDFFETFFEFSNSTNTIFSMELEKIKKLQDEGYEGKGWDHHDPKLGNITWPVEEASWLRLTYNKEKLFDAINNFIIYFDSKHNCNTHKEILDDIVKFQIFLLTIRNETQNMKNELFNYNWKDFFINGKNLRNEQKNYFYKNKVIEADSVQWCYKVMWYGRRQEKYKCHIENLQEQPIKPKILSQKNQNPQITI